jgi:hypothetical protein
MKAQVLHLPGQFRPVDGARSHFPSCVEIYGAYRAIRSNANIGNGAVRV